MEAGMIVRFKLGLYPDEDGLLYRVIEDRGDRVLIQLICDMRFAPMSVAQTEELHVIEYLYVREKAGQNPQSKASQKTRKRKTMVD